MSQNATVQAYQTKVFFTRIAPHHESGRKPSGLEADINLLCFSRKLLEVVAKGRCPEHTSEESVLLNRLPYWTPFNSNTDCGSASCLHNLHDALRDAEIFMTAFAAKAKQVRARVQDAVSQRGGFSLAERAAGSYGKGGIVRRARMLDRALDTLDALLSSLAVQHRILAGLAVRILHVCALQNGLRERARVLHEDQSAWWDLKWDAEREVVVLSVVTFPELENTVEMLQVAHDRMSDEYQTMRPRTKEAVEQLKAKLSAGWMERLGLGDLLPGINEREGKSRNRIR